jgi:triosephosphate isomerase
LPNAIGIDTKKNRGTYENSYFTDADFDIFKDQVDKAIKQAIASNKTIVIPADGIGTGKAELEKRAPKLFAYLQQQLNNLKTGKIFYSGGASGSDQA